MNGKYLFLQFPCFRYFQAHLLNLVIDSMKKLFVFFSLSALVLSCDKDKFETKPTLDIVDVNGNYIPRNATLQITLEFTDKEGDVDDSLYVIRQRLNKKSPITAAASMYAVPPFPNQSKGEIEVNLAYTNGITFGISPIRIPGSNPEKFEPDTMKFRFVLKDKAGNFSDTVTTDEIYIER